MNQKSLGMLEFPRIKEILAGYAAFAISKELVLSLGPSIDPAEIQRNLALSAEARHLLSIEPDLSIGGIQDIREPLVLASRGKKLELVTLVDIQRTLTSIRYLHNKISRLVDEAPLLAAVNSGITTHERLERNIERCVSPGGELLDTASPRLAELRSLLKEKRQQILACLDSMIKSKDTEKLLQEQLVTERDGRYVIPVKVEMRREMKGIVHDISNTGATAFVEPMATVDMGNELREAVIEEQHEVERILGELSASVGAELESISLDLKLVAEIDLQLSKARFAERYRAVEPLISGISDSEGRVTCGGRIIRLRSARHPLLKGNPVPLDIEIGKDFNGLVITGPNTGGKTVALKTIGLLAVMAQAGLPVPALHESCLPIFDGIFSDIGDEQSIEQTLSTFSWHMSNIVRIVKEATDRSLVLMDELGTSTDPGEGAALAQSILLSFLEKGAIVIATSHFSELKAFAHATPGLRNASLDFDPVTLAPRYHLSVGLPGGSNALAVASQLGLPAEIVENARERISKGSIEIETLLAELTREKVKLEDMNAAIQREKEDAEKLRLRLQEEEKEFREREADLLRETRLKIVREGDELQRQIRDLLDDLKKNRSRERAEKAQKALAAIRDQLKTQTWQPLQTEEEAALEKFAVGDRVWLSGLNIQGTISALPDSAGQFEVQVGNTRIKMSGDNLDKAESQSGAPARAELKRDFPSHKAVSRELDLRGKRADEEEIELDTYLNDASLANQPEVRIIHGMGTGTVRQIVRQFLASHPLVESFRSGNRNEGGDGVTIVRL